MTYLTLAEIKKHLNIDAAFTDDDAYLTALAEAAESATEIYLDYPLVQLEDSQGKIPQSVVQALLLLIGNWYSVRESISAASMNIVPQAYEFLCDLHRNYCINKTE